MLTQLGLGLNIVHSLVQLMQGTIDITSEIGTGTSVVVKLPLRRSEVPQISDQGYDTSFSVPSKTSFSIQGFRKPNAKLLAASLRRYLTEWYDLIDENGNAGTCEGVVFVDEEECPSWIDTSSQNHKLIVVCDQSRRRQLLEKYSGVSTIFEVLITPFGPHKLAKVLKACLESSNSTSNISSIGLKNAELEHKPVVQRPLAIRDNKQISEAIHISTAEKFPRYDENLKPGFSSVRRARILCVDDNAINLRLLKTFMDMLGFQDVACAENGSIAFETVRLRPERFDLIFMGTFFARAC